MARRTRLGVASAPSMVRPSSSGPKAGVQLSGGSAAVISPADPFLLTIYPLTLAAFLSIPSGAHTTDRWKLALDAGMVISGVGVALWGARRPDQLAPVRDVMGWRIDDASMREIDHILATTITDPVGPEFMAPQQRPDSRPTSSSSAGTS